MLPSVFLPDLNPEYVLQTMSEVYDWGLQDLNVPEVHKHTLGEGIKIGIVDSGKSEHFETINNTAAARNFTDSPSVNDKNGHSCLHPDGQVFTTNNGLETIQSFYQSINKPEICLDNNSSSKYVGDLNIRCISYSREKDTFEMDKIEFVHKIPVVDEILCVEIGKNRHVKLTKDHPTYTVRGGNVEIKECKTLTPKDKLLCNNSFLSLSEKPILIKYGLIRKCQNCGHIINIIKSHKGRRQCKKCNKSEFVDQPHSKLLTPEWGYLAGLILSDGHIHYAKNGKFITITNSNDNILEHAESIFVAHGYKTKRYPDKRNPRLKGLVICSKELCEFFMALGIQSGNKTKTQEMPKQIALSPSETIMAFMAGVVDGDGHVSENRRVIISSGSLNFCKQLTYLLLSLGIRARYLHAFGDSDRAINGRECFFSNVWHIIIENPHQIAKYMSSSCKETKLVSNERKRSNSIAITRITPEFFDGYFYDFTTSNHHNYQGNGVIISNTFIAGIIAAERNNEGVIGVAPKSNLYFAKAMDDAGRGNPSALVKAVAWCIDQKVDIISISAGMFFDFKPLHRIIRKAFDKNIIILAATGNTGKRHFDVAFPARYPEAIGVAAYDQRHKVAEFSSRGANVACAMPGVDVYSTHLNNNFCKSNGTCLSGNSRVYTNFGPIPIKMIDSNNWMVLSLNEDNHVFEWRKVVNHWKHSNRSIIKISTKHTSIECTPEHLMLCVRRGSNDAVWTPASECRIGDSLISPPSVQVKKFLLGQSEQTQLPDCPPRIHPADCWGVSYTGEPFNSDISVDGITLSSVHGFCHGIHGLRFLYAKHIIDRHNIEYKHLVFGMGKLHKKISLPAVNEDFAYLLGFFAGDGWITKGCRCARVYFAKGINESINGHLCDTFYRVFHQELNENSNQQYVCGNTVIADIFAQFFDITQKAKEKYIPLSWFDWPIELQRAAIAGLVDSDGCIQNSRTRVYSSSKYLILDLARLCDYAGLRRNIPNYRTRYIKAPHSAYEVKSEEWSILIDPPGLSKKVQDAGISLDERIEKLITSRITSINSTDDCDDCDVYDIEVDGLHNFVAENLVVHNSFACPMLAGVCALILSRHRQLDRTETPCETPRQMMEHLKKYAKDLNGNQKAVGFGTLDADEMLRMED